MRIIDAVRQFGNFSAHEKKSLRTLQIIDVEPGEAELCVEIVEGLFEHYYVRPVIETEKLEKVNEKLRQLAGCGRKVRRSAAVYGASTVSAAFGM